MINQTIEQPSAVKKKQYRNLGICVLAVIIITVITCYAISDDTPPPKKISNAQTISMASPLDHVDAGSVLLEREENNLQQERQKTAQFEQQLAQTKTEQAQVMKNETTQMQALQTEMEQMKNEMVHPKVLPIDPLKSGALAGADHYAGSVFPGAPGADTQMASNGLPIPVPGISRDALSLTASILAYSVSLPPDKNPDTYVPSGTFARAVMTGGADASASVNSQANPSPMLFRILANGTLPNHQHSHLKNCVVTAAVIGDISSERGLIRLERLSCTHSDGEIVDMPVEGTIFGPEGKNGVRGVPLWREGALLQRAFMAGTLSGFANGLSQKYTTNSISPLGNTQTISTGGVFQYGAAQGASNAMEKLADYNIQRAEQYHPVIQLSAGTVVDVVFLKGFYLDGKKHDENTPNTNGMTETSPIPASQMRPPQAISIGQNLQPLPLTPQQISRLQARDAQMGFGNHAPT